jgi:hypothetical protein
VEILPCRDEQNIVLFELLEPVLFTHLQDERLKPLAAKHIGAPRRTAFVARFMISDMLNR